MVERARALIHESLAFDRRGISRKKAFALLHLRLWIQIFKQLVRDRCLQQASSLAYKTLLSLVPTVAVALSLLKAFGAFAGPDSALVRFVAGLVMPPDKSQVLATQIIAYTDKISFGAIGGIGTVSLLVVAVSLLDTVDTTINEIWKIRRKRSMVLRFTTYYALLTLGPVLLAVSILQSARLQGLFSGELVGRLQPHLSPVIVTWIGLTLAYKLFPNTQVRWGPAVVGALVAALGFEAVKYGFNMFVSETLSSSYTKIYGAMALVPLFLVWIYTVWIIVLFGVEYTYTLQNLRVLVQEDRDHRAASSGEDRQGLLPAVEVGARLLMACLVPFEARAPAPSRDDLQARLGLPGPVVDVALRRLVDMGLLRLQLDPGTSDERDAPEVFLPVTNAQSLDLAEVLAGWDAASRSLGQGQVGDALEAALAKARTLQGSAQPGAALASLLPASGEAAAVRGPAAAPRG